jgi:hypothetical protein
MVKNVIVSFDFDSETESVTNVQCTVGGVEKKKRVSRKKEEAPEEMASEAIITLEAAKLVFNNKAVADMELSYEDRVFIKWETYKKSLIPIIGKDEENGNKLTKTNTVGYKGKQNAVLAEYGNKFTIEPYKDGTWKLLSIDGGDIIKEVDPTPTRGEKVAPSFIVDSNDDTDIEPFKFTI